MKAILILSCLILIFEQKIQAQHEADSLIDRLEDHNRFHLDAQLKKLTSHDFLAKLDPDKRRWPALIASIANDAVRHSLQFSNAGQVIVASYMAEAVVREGNVPDGYAFARSAMQKALGVDGLTQSYAYSKYSDILGYLNFLDSSIYYSGKILDIAHEIRNDSLEKVSLDQLAILCYRAKNYPKAEVYFKQLCAHPGTTDKDRMYYYNTIGLTFRKRQMFDSSNRWYSRSLPIAAALHDTAWIGLLHGNTGYNFYLVKDYARALPELLLDLKYSFRMHGYSSGLNALGTITNIHIAKNDKKGSKVYYDSLRKNLHLNPSPEMRLEFLKISSDYYELEGNLVKALEFARLTARLDDSIQLVQNVAKAADLEAQFGFTRQARKIEALEAQGVAQVATNQQKNYLLLGTSIFIIFGIGFTYMLYRNNRFKFKTNNLLKQQNAKITQQAHYLNQLNDTKDKLFSIISHDLRGPINSLRSLMTMVHKKMITPEEFNHFLGQLENNVEHVHFTLDNLLQWSRSQLQGIQTKAVVTQLADLADESLNLFSDPIAVKSIKALNNIPRNIDVLADPDQIRLVFRNLISNAIKFSKNEGSICISAMSEGKMIAISVWDKGIGMTADVSERLFNTGSSVSTAGTDGEKGTGLGLVLCKEMVERNGGGICFESKPDEGSRFTFTLPLAPGRVL